MIQEYLFIDNTHREAVEKYVPDKATREIHDIDNSTCWIVTYSLSKENEDSAKVLSQINNYVVDHFKPTVLTNEKGVLCAEHLMSARDSAKILLGLRPSISPDIVSFYIHRKNLISSLYTG